MIGNDKKSTKNTPSDTAARCHEIQVGLGSTNVPDFENLITTGMAVRLALHLRGLPQVPYDVVRLVAIHYLEIPNVAVRSIVELLGEIEFVRIISEGSTFKAIVPDVPYYDDLYCSLGEVAASNGFNETEALSIEIVRRLAEAPENVDSLRNSLGAETKLFDRALQIGDEGGYVFTRRRRGRDIAISPAYFSENGDIYADLAAAGNTPRIKHLLTAVRAAQGIPLSLIVKNRKIGEVELSDQDVQMLIRLAQDGAVKPPAIKTTYAGENQFIFTPTPGSAALSPTKRDIYEKAMAVVAAIRQGQFLPNRYAIRSPGAVLYTLKNNLRLGKATTEATQQYQNLVRLRVAQLIPIGNGFAELRIIDTEENREAVNMAYALVSNGEAKGTEVDDDARKALQQNHSYVESIVASGALRKNKQIDLTEEQQLEFEQLLHKA